MDFSVLNPKQRHRWHQFENGLNDLNRRMYKSRFDLWWIEQAIDFYKRHTEALPPSFQYDDITAWMAISKKWIGAVQALNNAYALSQAGNAYLSQSEAVPGDLDLVVDKSAVSQNVIDAATFKSAMAPESPDVGIAPLVPLLIKGAIVIGAAIIVSGIVEKVSDTITKHKRIDLNIEKIKANIERDMASADPNIYKMWVKKKDEEIKPAQDGFLHNLQQGAGSALTVGLIAVGLFVAWKIWQGRK